MTLKILGTGLLAATMLAGISTLATAQSTECTDLKGSTASLSGDVSAQQRTPKHMPSRDDWVDWVKDQAAKPVTKVVAEQHKELLKQEKAEATENAAPTKSTANGASATTGSATPGDRATDRADDPEAEANTAKSNADGSEHYSAPSGGYRSGAHIGNESPTDTGNSANGMEKSRSAERINLKDCMG